MRVRGKRGSSAGFVLIPFLVASYKNERFAISFNLTNSREDIAPLSALTPRGDVVVAMSRVPDAQIPLKSVFSVCATLSTNILGGIFPLEPEAAEGRGRVLKCIYNFVRQGGTLDHFL